MAHDTLIMIDFLIQIYFNHSTNDVFDLHMWHLILVPREN
jgi:hypothetical protein